MKIMKFNESKDDFFSLIKDYFSSFEEIEDICNIEFTKVGDNLFIIKISPKSNLQLIVNGEEEMFKIDQQIIHKNNDIKILKELKRSMQMLMDEDIIDGFHIDASIGLGYKIEIYTKGKGTEWIFIDGWQVKYDKNILKRILFEKFGVKVINSSIEEGDDYLGIEIKIEPIRQKLAEDVKNFLLKKTSIDPDGDIIDVFEECTLHKRATNQISYIELELNNLLSI